MSRAKAPHLREGNPRESTSPAVPDPENILPVPPPPDPPPHLGPVGRNYWTALWEAGAEAYNRVTDAPAIDRYCSLQERRVRFLNILDTEGYTDVGSKGQTIAHPVARLLSDVEQKLTPLEDRLGLNPDARLRLGIAAIEKKSRLEAFMEDE